jgi:hypothetical protein
MYDKLSRQDMLRLLAAARVQHDALICRRDGSCTVRLGYTDDLMAAVNATLGKLQKNTRAEILGLHTGQRGLDKYFEVRFAFHK